MSDLDRQAELAAAFLDGTQEVATQEIGAVLAGAHDAGRRAWPAIDLDAEVFARFLGARLAVEELAGEEPPLAADLYLACACAVGVPGASAQLIRSCDDAVRAALGRVLDPADRPDLAQRAWEQLLVASDGGEPRIAQYRGRGPLIAFIRIAAVRLAISERRKLRPTQDDRLELQQIVDDTDDIELQYMKQLYRDEFRRSFARAFAALDAPQQLLLRLDVVERLTIDQTAAVYGRSRTTTGRHLLEARQTLARDTLADLQARLALDPADLHSVARLIRSQIDLSVQRILAAP